ncbi:hypothetical protein FHS16_002514 [Paenibacillus endophyticus]|uniref:Uncharacterized protein n=1 Tax=Paenibacillus endophyticus TaxID=1294268 RepID=A0A7W5C967_9BACL|nr:DUF960 family protein [Paenibacillus endophyticus]MBB3152464.1 hypothetical protein [Paenibacillus endophyticus]
MFTGTKYVTQGIRREVPSFLQLILWCFIESMNAPEKDFLQVFELSPTMVNGKTKQRIVHMQEQPPFQQVYVICARQIVTKKIYVVDDQQHCTMLCSDEY